MIIRPPPDWERIEMNFRAGLLTLREMARTDGNVTEGAIRKRAKRDSWKRNLRTQVIARVEELVRAGVVRTELLRAPRTRSEPLTETETVEVAASAIVQIKLGHQGASRRGVDLGMKLVAELEWQTENLESLEQLGEIMSKPDVKGAADKMYETYRKVVSMAGRASTYKTLIDGLRVAVDMQRKAFDMDTTAADTEGTLASRLKALSDAPVPAHAEMPHDC